MAGFGPPGQIRCVRCRRRRRWKLAAGMGIRPCAPPGTARCRADPALEHGIRDVHVPAGTVVVAHRLAGETHRVGAPLHVGAHVGVGSMHYQGLECERVARLQVELQQVELIPLSIPVGHCDVTVFRGGPEQLALPTFAVRVGERLKVLVPQVRAPDELERAVLLPNPVEGEPDRDHLLALDGPVGQIVVELGTVAAAGSDVEHLVVEQVELLRPGELGRDSGDGRVEAEVPEHLVVLPDPELHEVLVGAAIGHRLHRRHVLAGLPAPDDPLVVEHPGKMHDPVVAERFELRPVQEVRVPTGHLFPPASPPRRAFREFSITCKGPTTPGSAGTSLAPPPDAPGGAGRVNAANAGLAERLHACRTLLLRASPSGPVR